MVTSIVSVLTANPRSPRHRHDGRDHAQGPCAPDRGLKEKLLAALRGGLLTVLIPKENEKDLAEIPDNVKCDLKIIPVTTVDEVISQALSEEPVPVNLADDDPLEGMPTPDSDDPRDEVVTH